MSLYEPSVSLTNGLGTQQVLELATRWRVRSFVYLSSVPVIGLPDQLPITETHPLDPPTAYHASKVFGERLVNLARREGLPALTLRLTSPVGPGTPDGRIAAVFVRRALDGEPLEVFGQGTRAQDYVDVRDVASAVLGSIIEPEGGLLNIASGSCVTNVRLAQCCLETLGSASQINFIDRPDPQEGLRWEVSIAKARLMIGYEPRHSLTDSINAIAEGIRLRGDA
jgi:UDP-glucose 4-epimerase